MDFAFDDTTVRFRKRLRATAFAMSDRSRIVKTTPDTARSPGAL